MTIKDIAKLADVSVSTVSRVLNDRPDVSEDSRRRVRAVIEAHRYVPNNSARDLVKIRSDAVGLVVRGVQNPFYTDIIHAIEQKLDASGYTMVMRQIPSGDDEIQCGAVMEKEKRLRGIIFLGGRSDYSPEEVSLLGVPYVCCSYSNCFGTLREEDFSSVTVDDHKTAYQAVESLIKLGHRRIAVLLPSCNDRSVSELRYNGYCAALRDNGIAFDSALVAETGGCFEMPESYTGMCRLIDSGADFSAVFTLSDTMAISAMKALEDRGRRVPEDCSVIAIDGLTVSEYVSPTLTTLVQPAEEMGRESVRILLDILDNGGANRHVRLEAKVRPGASVKQL